MAKNVLKGLGIILGVLFLYGCAATKDVEVRHYIDVKDRIDQKMEEGNAGFIAGTPQPEDRSGVRKTRKIYVVEVSKGAGEDEEGVAIIDDEDGAMDESDSQDKGYEYNAPTPLETMDLGYDDVDQTDAADAADEIDVPSPSVVEYTVQKDDTLQKISKKFYDSYSKWSKIYELNKDVISDPDRIKPGTVIQVPVIK